MTCTGLSSLEVDTRSQDVAAIVVTFHPEPATLSRLLECIAPQVGEVLVVDNGSPTELVQRSRDRTADGRIQSRELDDNLGVGTAHNLGIAWARRRGYSFVLLLDQDSIPEPDMVQKLLAGYRDVSQRDRVAAVGPAYLDPRTGRFGPFVRFGTFRNQHIPSRTDCQSVLPKTSNAPIRTDFLITSGTLIPLSVLDEIGGLDEGLFVDYVDTEWSLRAASLGYRLYGVPDAVMRHTIGDRVRRFGPFRIHANSPLRLYYNIRNRFLLMRKPHAQGGTTIRGVLHAMRLFLIYGLLIGPRWNNLRMLCRGLCDAWAGRVGRLDLARLPEEWQRTLQRAKRKRHEEQRDWPGARKKGYDDPGILKPILSRTASGSASRMRP